MLHRGRLPYKGKPPDQRGGEKQKIGCSAGHWGRPGRREGREGATLSFLSAHVVAARCLFPPALASAILGSCPVRRLPLSLPPPMPIGRSICRPSSSRSSGLSFMDGR